MSRTSDFTLMNGTRAVLLPDFRIRDPRALQLNLEAIFRIAIDYLNQSSLTDFFSHSSHADNL
jgi:hypothetical protein